MNTQTIIENKIKEWHGIFPQLSFRYEFDNCDNSHLVEILPEKEFYTNKELNEAIAHFSYDFDETYQEDTLIFLSADALCEIKNPRFTIRSRPKEQFSISTEAFSNNIEINSEKHTRVFSGTHSYLLAA